MNRTDRLYAIVEELRAIAPRLRTARELAARYEVSVRTIERDIAALQQASIPIYADVGRRGGYALEKSMSLPPLNFTPAEAVALAVALARSETTPFDQAGHSALRKILGVMSERNAAAARDLAARIRLVDPADAPPTPAIPAVIGQSIEAGRVLRISYSDRFGTHSERDVEPIAFLSGSPGWYLIAWCRLREESRCFRLDRIRAVTMTDLPVPPRPLAGTASDIPDFKLRSVAL
ncbi:WYL domain-containing protein [Nocardia sp. NBC_00565]|uniref:helix-turn-helix transcriptional regulator n=1 Tax=Nocardia sp. NBC_00565 TaxID=2975993 RepID=UPI002E8081F7|nr:WYL domain-containing protein [Nocardia sp. NBC_00565]WUC04934.1 WYL domain-containing protein [Nocardia sp. NBC_00565]